MSIFLMHPVWVSSSTTKKCAYLHGAREPCSIMFAWTLVRPPDFDQQGFERLKADEKAEARTSTRGQVAAPVANCGPVFEHQCI